MKYSTMIDRVKLTGPCYMKKEKTGNGGSLMHTNEIRQQGYHFVSAEEIQSATQRADELIAKYLYQLRRTACDTKTNRLLWSRVGEMSQVLEARGKE